MQLNAQPRSSMQLSSMHKPPPHQHIASPVKELGVFGGSDDAAVFRGEMTKVLR